MQELLPVALGLLIGLAAMRLSTTVSKLATSAPACVLAGAAASAINGELAQRGWLVFVSVDSLLVWLGAALCVATLATLRRMAVPSKLR
jgi:hypothetical protein